MNNMRRFSLVALLALTLAACGGDSLSGQSSASSTGGTTTTGPTVAGINLITSSPQIASDGTGPATVTALVRDKNNVSVTGATVAFTASSGLLAVTKATTDASGTATATLSSGADPSNRTITVTATSGTATASVPVSVIGTSLSLSGAQQLVEPGSATYTVTLKNAGGVGIVDQTITLTSANKNTLSAATVMTDANGQATFTLTAANGGADTLTATALGISATEAVSVSAQNFAFTAPTSNADVNIGGAQTVTVKWTNGGTAVAGQPVSFSSTRGTLSAATATTDGTGTASVSISSTTSGPAVITASGTDVSTEITIDFIATTPSNIAVQASPSTIGISAQSTVTAVVRDASNNLVEGKMVAFSLTDITGGTLSVASALTNSQGVAQTIYTASTTTSAQTGVTVTATVQGTTVKDSTTITVAGITTFLSLGTGNSIAAPNATQYSMPFSIQAIDGAGNAVDGVTVNLRVTAISYRKGTMVFGTAWTPPSNAPVCMSEDLNNNGILDPGEDFNGDGILEPGTVASATPGTVTTATAAQASATLPEGSASFSIVYPKDHSQWVMVKLTATATVSGTESSTSTTFELPALAADVNSATISPPGFVSPYGVNPCAVPN
jgi:Bacterial Ig-like domain (group 1)